MAAVPEGWALRVVAAVWKTARNLSWSEIIMSASSRGVDRPTPTPFLAIQT